MRDFRILQKYFFKENYRNQGESSTFAVILKIISAFYTKTFFFLQTVNEITLESERIWMPVHSPNPQEGLLIVNLGKNMDFWTGGRFKAQCSKIRIKCVIMFASD